MHEDTHSDDDKVPFIPSIVYSLWGVIDILTVPVAK